MKQVLQHFLRAFAFLAVCMSHAAAYAVGPDNSITVRKFEEDPNDARATVDKVMDKGTNKPCALILVTNDGNLDGFLFNTRSHYSKVEEGTMADGRKIVKLWISPNAKRIDISHKSSAITPLRNYDFGGKALKEATVYHLNLGYVALPNPTDRQYVEFIVSPTNAYLEVEGEPWPLDKTGYATKPLLFGTYHYTLSAEDHHDEAGTFVLNDPNQKKVVTVTMRQDYGWLTLSGEAMRDADIFIDQQKYNYTQLDRLKLKSGRHTMKIVRKNYSPYARTFDIEDARELRLSPELNANYSTVTIKAPKGCSIIINGENMGVGNWTGPMEPGTYNLEARMAGHRPFRTQYEVRNINNDYTVTLEAPEPIYGSLDINSDPKGAAITIDGQSSGKVTPHVEKVLIGSHVVELSKPGYQPFKQTVNVDETGISKVDARLTNTVSLKVSWTPSDAKLYINGKEVATSSPYTFTCPPTKVKQSLRLEKSGYHDSEKLVSVERNSSVTMSMNPIVYHDYVDWGHEGGDEYERYRYFYITADGGFGNTKSAGGSMGFVYSRLNMQFDVGYCFDDGVEFTQYSSYTHPRSSSITPGLYFGGRIGIPMQAGRMVFTPQVGYRHLMAEDSWVGSGIAALRMQIRTSSHFAFILSPEYCFAVAQGDLFKLASEKWDDVKKFGTGFRIGVGMEFYF